MNERLELFSSEHIGLTWDFQVNPETCGNNTHYENYIRFSTLSDKRYGLGTTHVLIYSRCDFAKLSDYAEVPRNGANDECIPMAIRIRE